MDGKLFSQDFLKYGITESLVWQTVDESEFKVFKQNLTQIFTHINADNVINEANTESEIIDKVLNLLGFQNLSLKQVTATKKRRDDVPDYLLFANTDKKQLALNENKEDRRYLHNLTILEAKKWMRPLDRGDATNTLDPSTPSNQILRYLSSVEIASNRAISFGILTNGAVWRLYWQGARSRSEEFLEIDLAQAISVKGVAQSLFELPLDHILKVFYCAFHRHAFLPQAWDNAQRTFHGFALNEARLYEEKVSKDLGQKVFDYVFPQLANALAQADDKANLKQSEYLDELREATLVLLYRLLFVFYAEDRHLLPVKDKRYDDYALRTIREDIAKRRDANDALSTAASKYWQHLSDLFRIISKGDTAIGMPAYNGGLFEETRAPILGRVRLSDAVFAPLLDDLSRSLLGSQRDFFRSYINYRDLSVQHLGGIYERLLQFSLVVENKTIVASPASFARKTSGSYYTHDDLVQLVVKEAVGPQIKERLVLFNQQLAEWKHRKELKPDDWKTLNTPDPAAAILELKICDPAMGSGHFLVTLVDYLADALLEIMAQIELDVASQAWASDTASPHTSPLVARIKEIRDKILSAANKEKWAVTESQLDDKHIVRRMILKRVIYGVDKNPMAVELAKVSLWLHTFTVGAPLSFLDHHLRCGDSLFGGRISHISDELAKLGGVLYQNDLQRLDSARTLMTAIGNLTDIDIAEAHHSKAMMDEAEFGLAPIKRTLDFLQAKRWASRAELIAYNSTWAGLLAQEYGENLIESVGTLAQRGIKLPGERHKNAITTFKNALKRADAEHFLHWEIAFPTVWLGAADGGFDAIIGNPPWGRIKLQEVEWFAERRPDIAMATKAADRKKLIADLQKNADPLWLEYCQASENAEISSKVVRQYGDYPLLSGGDINLYSLFVERASHLIKPTGIVGLITPSGIAADLGAAAFFRTLTSPISTSTITAVCHSDESQNLTVLNQESVEKGMLNQVQHDNEVDAVQHDGDGVATTKKAGARLAALFDFENKKVFFPDADSRFKFSALIFGGKNRSFDISRCAFYLHNIKELETVDATGKHTRILELSAADFSAVNPNTGAAPIFRNARDAQITTAVYRHQPVLVDKRDGQNIKKVWPVRYATMFHMTNDSHLFMRQLDLQTQGWYPVGENRWKKGEAEAVPLYVGRMIYHYDHRAASVATNEENLKVATNSDFTTDAEKANPDFYPTPQYWVATSDIPQKDKRDWVISFRDIARATDARTMIATISPTVAAGNKLPLLRLVLESSNAEYTKFAPLLLANLNTYVFDFVARQKTQSTSMNWYIVEQLPLIKPEQFESLLSHQNIADYIRAEVLHLTYTANDLAPFARDMGYVNADCTVKAPVLWNSVDRLHRQCRLDALFF